MGNEYAPFVAPWGAVIDLDKMNIDHIEVKFKGCVYEIDIQKFLNTFGSFKEIIVNNG